MTLLTTQNYRDVFSLRDGFSMWLQEYFDAVVGEADQVDLNQVAEDAITEGWVKDFPEGWAE